MYDLLIKNGLVVDGTGAPRRHAAVTIAGGKIVEIGKVTHLAVIPPGNRRLTSPSKSRCASIAIRRSVRRSARN
jgi:cytosine/adenosine deaminase-related metal-dependent hydrolase